MDAWLEDTMANPEKTKASREGMKTRKVGQDGNSREGVSRKDKDRSGEEGAGITGNGESLAAGKVCLGKTQTDLERKELTLEETVSP
jgi:hypothetical protein